MNRLISELMQGKPLNEQKKQQIVNIYHSRGKKALSIIDENRVARFRDFFVVKGDTGEYVVEENFCTCDDYLHRKSECCHIIAVKIARATGKYKLIDKWYHETFEI